MILLHKATEKDIPAIQHIATATWGPTYVPILGQKQVDYMLDNMYSKVVLLQQLMEGQVFLMASIDSAPIAFVSYSAVKGEDEVYKLHKLYVLPEAHGKGAGKFLVNEVVNKVRDAGGKSLELNVNRENRAKDFYEKAGFKVKETVDIPIGNGFFMNDYVMKMAIS